MIQHAEFVAQSKLVGGPAGMSRALEGATSMFADWYAKRKDKITIFGVQWMRVIESRGPVAAIEVMYDGESEEGSTDSDIDLHAQDAGISSDADGGDSKTHSSELSSPAGEPAGDGSSKHKSGSRLVLPD